jgi:3'-phosphoadenosine 5'-phosphosulfate sulfotransferase (PAPS reductase)/FAD synthetase
MSEARLFPDRPLDEAIAEAKRIVNDAGNEYGPIRTFGLFSGGKDSTVLLHLFRDQIDAAVHINTLTGIPQTTEFVRATCAEWDLPLIEKTPPEDARYEKLVIQYGFPGPAMHRVYYSMLKERALRELRREHVKNRGDRIMLVGGMRKAESRRRMGNTEESHREGSVVWCSPLTWWSNDEMAEYRRTYSTPVSEVVTHLHMSGECLCGAYAAPGELDEIAFFYPEVAARIRDLQDQAEAAGVPRCKWGVNTETPKPGQVEAFEFGPLCSSCEVRAAALTQEEPGE